MAYPPLRGQVYFRDQTVLPPNQKTPHRFVIVSPNSILANSGAGVFANVVIIRSAQRPDGSRVRLVPGHSIPVSPRELKCLSHDSIIETHQVFALPIELFKPTPGRPAWTHVDQLGAAMLDRTLEYCRRLFT